MLTLNVLAAKHGDCLVVSYGPSGEHYVLIDGGPAHSYDTGLRQFLLDRPDLRHFELMILTHVDTDHIDGALCLLNDVHHGALPDLVIDEVWFNGWEQMTGRVEDRGPSQGDYFVHLLAGMGVSLNAAFGGNAVYRDLGHEIELPGGATLTVLSPSKRELDRMRVEWAGALSEADYDPDKAAERLSNRQMYQPKVRGEDRAGKTKRSGSDVSAANGSSIGVLFEYAGQRLLLPGDAHARTLAESISRYNNQWGIHRMMLDLFKLSHHGSVGNLTAELLELIECSTFVVSSNGDRFGHPDIECLDLLAARSRRGARRRPFTVYFNYPSRIEQLRTQSVAAGRSGLPGELSCQPATQGSPANGVRIEVAPAVARR